MSAKTDACSNAPFQVQEPFTPNEYADVIIRSGDGHDFHVIKAFLSLCSPFFKDMFSLPQPPTASGRDAKSDLPIVMISESGAVTDIFLRNIYPVNPPAMVNDSLCSSVLLAAQKYEVKRIIDAGRRHINELCSGDDESSAYNFLRRRLLDPSIVHTFDSLPGRAVACLFIYHGEVGRQVVDLLSNVSDLTMDIVEHITCSSCLEYEPYSVDVLHRLQEPKWWDIASRSIMDVVATEGSLSAAAVSRQTFEGLSFGCDDCKICMLQYGGVEVFMRTVRKEMERVASEVKFKIPWET